MRWFFYFLGLVVVVNFDYVSTDYGTRVRYETQMINGIQ